MEYYKQKEADWLREEQYWANQWYKTFCISQFCELFGVIAALIALAVVKQVDIVVSFM